MFSLAPDETMDLELQILAEFQMQFGCQGCTMIATEMSMWCADNAA